MSYLEIHFMEGCSFPSLSSTPKQIKEAIKVFLLSNKCRSLTDNSVISQKIVYILTIASLAIDKVLR